MTKLLVQITRCDLPPIQLFGSYGLKILQPNYCYKLLLPDGSFLAATGTINLLQNNVVHKCDIRNDHLIPSDLGWVDYYQPI